MPKRESQRIKGRRNRRGGRKADGGLERRQADQSGRGARASRQVGRRSQGEEPTEQKEEPQVELEGEC